jgi:hypothetical protein
MASPLFDPPKAPKSLESLAQEEVRAILRLGGIMAVAADTHPGIFAHALSKVQAGEDFIFKGMNVAGMRPQPKVYLTKCKDNLLIGGLRAKDRFPAHGHLSLEQYLLEVIGEAFMAIGFIVDEDFPDRYHRRWVI